MEFLEHPSNPVEGVSCESWCLCKVAEVEESTESNKERTRNTTSYSAYDIALDGAMVVTGNLLQIGYTLIECSISYQGLDDGEMEI